MILVQALRKDVAGKCLTYRENRKSSATNRGRRNAEVSHYQLYVRHVFPVKNVGNTYHEHGCDWRDDRELTARSPGKGRERVASRQREGSEKAARRQGGGGRKTIAGEMGSGYAVFTRACGRFSRKCVYSLGKCFSAHVGKTRKQLVTNTIESIHGQAIFFEKDGCGRPGRGGGAGGIFLRRR